MFGVYRPGRRIEDMLEALGTRLRRVEDAMSPRTQYRDEVSTYWPVAVEGVVRTANVAALEERVTQLECAAKGHGETKTVVITGQRMVTGCSHETQWSEPIYIQTTVTCLDCGATISDDWVPKEPDVG